MSVRVYDFEHGRFKSLQCYAGIRISYNALCCALFNYTTADLTLGCALYIQHYMYNEHTHWPLQDPVLCPWRMMGSKSSKTKDVLV